MWGTIRRLGLRSGDVIVVGRPGCQRSKSGRNVPSKVRVRIWKKGEHGGYGEYPVRDLKAAIEWVRNPLAEEHLAEAAE